MLSQNYMKANYLYLVTNLMLLFFSIANFALAQDLYSTPNTPEEMLNLYFKAMKEHNSNPDLPIFTEESRQMLKTWKVTPSQMDNIVASYNSCTPDETKYDSTYLLAVIHYPINQKQCSPWFFQKHENSWKLDLTMMQKAVRFDNKNRWHFVPGFNHQYGFAFSDWIIDNNGYPR